MHGAREVYRGVQVVYNIFLEVGGQLTLHLEKGSRQSSPEFSSLSAVVKQSSSVGFSEGNCEATKLRRHDSETVVKLSKKLANWCGATSDGSETEPGTRLSKAADCVRGAVELHVASQEAFGTDNAWIQPGRR